VPKTSKGSARRERILEVARHVLAEEGVDGFVLRGIAERAGVALGNLQYYFPTRVDLLDAVVRAELDGDLRAMDDAAAGAGASDLDDVLARIVRSLLLRWTGASHSIYLSAGAIALHDADTAAVVDAVWGAFYGAIETAVRAADPTAAATEVRLRGAMITALLDGASLQRLSAVDLDPDDLVERICQQVVAIARGS
jgi:AcrR family transcriptional regulator